MGNKNTSPLANGTVASKYDDDEPLIDASETQDKEAQTFDLENEVKLSIRINKKSIRASSLTDKPYSMLISLGVGEQKCLSKAPIDLIFVIDHSAQMSGGKIEIIKKSLTYVIKCLGEKDRVSIVICNNNACRLTPLLRTTDDNKEKILSLMKDIQSEGGLDINSGMLHALQVIKQRRYANKVTSVFLLSDGLANEVHLTLKEELKELDIPDDISINTFLFGQEHDPQFMANISDLRDGTFYSIKTLDDAVKSFADCLAGLFSTVGKSVQVRVQPEQSDTVQGIEVIKKAGDLTNWEAANDAYSTRMANLISGRQRDFLLEIKLPSCLKEQNHVKGVKTASVQVEFADLNGDRVTKTAELYITILDDNDQAEEDNDDQEVLRSVYRFKSTTVIKEAWILAESRRYDEAKTILKDMINEIENSSVKGDNLIRNLITDLHETIKEVSPILFVGSGRSMMLATLRAHMYQKSNSTCTCCYHNRLQSSILDKIRTSKSPKSK